MSEGLTEVWGSEAMDAIEVKEATEANLVPKGRWPGELQPRDEGQPANRKVVQTEGGTHPLEGKAVYGCHVLLHTDEGDKHMFFDACPITVVATSKAGGSYTRQESTNAGHLYKGTKLIAQPFGEVLSYAMTHTLLYDIGIKKATDEYAAQNTLRGIYPQENGN